MAERKKQQLQKQIQFIEEYTQAQRDEILSIAEADAAREMNTILEKAEEKIQSDYVCNRWWPMDANRSAQSTHRYSRASAYISVPRPLPTPACHLYRRSHESVSRADTLSFCECYPHKSSGTSGCSRLGSISRTEVYPY